MAAGLKPTLWSIPVKAALILRTHRLFVLLVMAVNTPHRDQADSAAASWDHLSLRTNTRNYKHINTSNKTAIDLTFSASMKATCHTDAHPGCNDDACSQDSPWLPLTHPDDRMEARLATSTGGRCCPCLKANIWQWEPGKNFKCVFHPLFILKHIFFTFKFADLSKIYLLLIRMNNKKKYYYKFFVSWVHRAGGHLFSLSH